MEKNKLKFLSDLLSLLGYYVFKPMETEDVMFQGQEKPNTDFEIRPITEDSSREEKEAYITKMLPLFSNDPQEKVDFIFNVLLKGKNTQKTNI